MVCTALLGVDYLTRSQLAKELDRNPRTIDTWRREGRGPAPTIIGRYIYYRRETVRSWLLSQEGLRP